MRVASLFLFALVAGCGGHVAADDDGGADARSDTELVPVDTGLSDVIGPPTDVAPPPACPLLADPCFAQFAAEVSIAAACMGHPDTCASSGGADPSGCGTRTTDASGFQTCTWSDGAHTVTSSSDGHAFDARGELCYKFALDIRSGGADVTVVFPDGKIFVEHVTTTGSSVVTESVTCPDGTTTRTFTNDESATCGIAVTCCSSSTPPSCSG